MAWDDLQIWLWKVVPMYFSKICNPQHIPHSPTHPSPPSVDHYLAMPRGSGHGSALRLVAQAKLSGHWRQQKQRRSTNEKEYLGFQHHKQIEQTT